MKGTYVQTGDNLNYVNPTGEVIEAGTIIKFGTIAAVAASFIPANGLGVIATVGVWSVPKDESDIKAGAAIYYDDSADKATTTEKETALGIAVADADAEAETVKVKLNVGAQGKASEAV